MGSDTILGNMGSILEPIDNEKIVHISYKHYEVFWFFECEILNSWVYLRC